MALTDAGIRGMQPRVQSFKKADGRGLSLLVTPRGSKLWRLKYRFGGKEKQLALGAYPQVSLSEARKLRDAARSKIDQGIDPCIERKKQKAARRLASENSFLAIAEEYICKMRKERASATVIKANWFLSLLTPAIGQMPVSEVDPQMLLAALRRLEARGTYETAKKTRSFASRVFRYAVVTGRANSDPAALLSGALVSPKARHYAAILEPDALGSLLRAIDGYDGNPITRQALRILPHVFVRPGELRLSTWSEFELEKAIWTIPAGRMKVRRPHALPLSESVISMLAELRELTGSSGYVFPSVHSPRKPMSENTLNAALRRMGYAKEEVTAHGFRATASSLLNESGMWSPDAIERALSHSPRDKIRGVYHRGQHWEERVRMAAWWSDFLQRLARSGGPGPGHYCCAINCICAPLDICSR